VIPEPCSCGCEDLIEVQRWALQSAVDYVGETCRYDHHGYCQEHSLEEECYVKEITKALG
jgi:hypothetical protein